MIGDEEEEIKSGRLMGEMGAMVVVGRWSVWEDCRRVVLIGSGEVVEMLDWR